MKNPVLESVRQRVTRRSVPLGPTPAWPYHGTSDASVEKLLAAWSALQVHAMRCTQVKEVISQIVELAKTRGARTVLTDERTRSLYPELFEALESAGIQILWEALPQDEASRHEYLQRWAGADVGITDVIAAFADTGTLWVAGGRGGSRCASLLPPIHIALVPRSRVYPCFAAWIEAARRDGSLAHWLEASSALIAITGPSKTSDIEKVLTIGVHGPKEVVALLIEEA